MYRQAVAVSVLVLLIICGSKAGAMLGGTLSSTQKTQGSLPGPVRKATLKAAAGSPYTTQELTTNGITVREYASSDGIIFAVTWRGVAEPDLQTLFGSYYTEYKSENEKTAASRAAHKTVSTSAIEVRRSGHMRDKRGLAFIADRVPAGVDVGDLQ